MAPVLYMIEASPPCRAVLLTAKAIGVTLERKEVNLMNEDHMTPEFLKMNPQHTIPTLDDNGVYIGESHAINAYLVNKYAKDDSLYPKDPVKRAMVDQRLHFDTGVLFSLCRQIARPLYLKKLTTVPKEKIVEVLEAYDFLEKFLEGNKWIAGNSVTIADLSLIATITSIQLFVNIDAKKYPNVIGWMKRASELPYYGENEGVKDFYKIFKSILEA